MEPSTAQASPVPVETINAAPDAPAVVAAPVVEAPKVETPPEDSRLARGFSALSKKEKALRVREQEVKAKSEQYARVEALREKAKADPGAVLSEFGLTYEQLTDWVLGTEKPAPTADDKVAALEARIERERTEADARKAMEAQQATKAKIAAFKDGVLKLGLQGNPDKFELINARGEDGVELVWNVIEAYHEKHGVVPDWTMAADHVEQGLEVEARKLLGLKKFKPAIPAPSEKDTASPSLSRSRAGELAVTDDYSLPMDPDERTRAQLTRSKFWG